MTLKYDFNITQDNNIFIDALVYTNTNSSQFVVYGIVLMLTIIALVVFNNSQDDMNLSFLYALFMGTMISTIFYYLGLFLDVSLFNGNILMGMVLTVVALGGLMFYSRNKLGGD